MALTLAWWGRPEVKAEALALAAEGTQESRSPELEVLVLGGLPIREPIAWGGPFVMNTREEVLAAFEDYQRGRMGSIPAVHGAPTDIVSASNGTA